jgi:hypothetical protein
VPSRLLDEDGYFLLRIEDLEVELLVPLQRAGLAIEDLDPVAREERGFFVGCVLPRFVATGDLGQSFVRDLRSGAATRDGARVIAENPRSSPRDPRIPARGRSCLRSRAPYLVG